MMTRHACNTANYFVRGKVVLPHFLPRVSFWYVNMKMCHFRRKDLRQFRDDDDEMWLQSKRVRQEVVIVFDSFSVTLLSHRKEWQQTTHPHYFSWQFFMTTSHGLLTFRVTYPFVWGMEGKGLKWRKRESGQIGVRNGKVCQGVSYFCCSCRKGKVPPNQLSIWKRCCVSSTLFLRLLFIIVAALILLCFFNFGLLFFFETGSHVCHSIQGLGSAELLKELASWQEKQHITNKYCTA